jgi:hypothetical protein
VSRLVIGNLAAEIDWARAATAGPHREVTAEVTHLIRQHAQRLAIFGADRLWRPGDAWPPAPAAEILAWAETDAVAALRSAASHPDPDPGGWLSRLWRLHPAAAVACAVNHRGFAFALAAREGWALPDARIVRSLAELPRGPGPWIAKAPYSAAGRERVRFARAEDARPRLERLLARFGELVVEPWVDRVADLGCAGLVDPAGTRLFPPHRLDCDARGVFRAAVIDDSGATVADPAVLAAVRDAALAAADALGAAGYRGPFSLDAYLWRDPAGVIHLQRMSEINARLTFGLVARAAAEREPGGGRFELRL